METFEILLRARALNNQDEAKRSGEACLALLDDYLAALSRNGQISGDAPIARVRAGYRVFVNAPRIDALKPRSANKRVRQVSAALIAAGFRPPLFRHIGSDPDGRPPCDCRRSQSLVMFADYRSNDSPVRCGDCFGPVPLYSLPPTDESGDHQDLQWWQSTYCAMDWLFIGSSAGERYAHRQMCDVRSPLSVAGRELAALLEAKTGRPVYYYLMKHYGSSLVGERRRRCPSCGKQWALDAALHGRFDFRCERCRLLSNIALDVRPDVARARPDTLLQPTSAGKARTVTGCSPRR